MKCTQCTLTMCLVVAEQARWKQTGPYTRSWWNLGVFWCFNSKHGCVGRAGKSHEFTILWPPRNPHLTHLHMRDARLAEISTYDDFIGRAHSDSAHAHTHTVSASFLPYICGRIADPYCRSLFYTGLHFLLVVELCLNDSTFVAFCWRFEEHRPCGGLRVPCSSSAEFSRFGAARVEANVHCPWHVHDIVTIVLHFGEPHL